MASLNVTTRNLAPAGVRKQLIAASTGFRARPETSCDGRGWEKFPPIFQEAARAEIHKVCEGDPGYLPDLDLLLETVFKPMSDTTNQFRKPEPSVDERMVGFLEKLQLSKYLPNFLKEEIDLDTLKELSESDLEKVGIPLGPRKKLLKEVQNPEYFQLSTLISALSSELKGSDEDPDSKNASDQLKLKISFQGWPPLRSEHEKMSKLTNEEMREKAKDIVTNVLDALMRVGLDKLGKRLVFVDVDLSHTMSSMRAIWKGQNGLGKKICRELEVTHLNLSFTVTSSRSVASLYLMKNLSALYLDHCSSLKKTKKVFSLLMQKGVVPALETLSVVGTSDVFSPDWLTQVESKCPKLKVVFFTRAPGTKAIGWNDAILMQTMRSPVLLPCGHIGDKDVVKNLGKCSFDRQIIPTVEVLIDLNPHITRLDKSDGHWTAQVVDNSRNKLESKVLYHVLCGEFYNLSTVQRFYGYKGTTLAQDTILFLLKQPCAGCWRTFNSKPELRICFLYGAEDTQSQDFHNLSELGDYTASELEGIYPHYDPKWDEDLMNVSED